MRMAILGKILRMMILGNIGEIAVCRYEEIVDDDTGKCW